MLSLAEYQAYANDIEQLGLQTDQQIDENIQDASSKQDATKKTQALMGFYQQHLKFIIDQALWQIAQNTYQHYTSQIQKEIPEEIIKSVIKDQYRRRYYGATLQQRFILMRLRLNRVVNQTAAVGTQHLSGLFSEPIPFGAQTNISKRLLQGTAIKVEQDMARKIADYADYKFIRWSLSKHHRFTCDCEILAARIDKDVKSYIEKNNLDIDPTGLYFVDQLPDPPHPNCQCEFDLVGEDHELIPSHGRRLFSTIRHLIRKILGS